MHSAHAGRSTRWALFHFLVFKMSPLSFDNGWTDRNVDCCVNSIPSMIKITTATNLVNFGPVTYEILWLICIGGECT